MTGIVNSTGARSGVIGTTSMPPSSFMAGFSGSPSWQDNATANTKVPFNSVTVNHCFNVGGDFDTTNNRYVAPSNGVYTFTMQFYTGSNQNISNFQFRIDGDVVMANSHLYNNAASPYYTGDSGDVIDHSPKLNRSQYVECYISGVASDYYEGHTVFWGARLS